MKPMSGRTFAAGVRQCTAEDGIQMSPSLIEHNGKVVKVVQSNSLDSLHMLAGQRPWDRQDENCGDYQQEEGSHRVVPETAEICVRSGRHHQECVVTVRSVSSSSGVCRHHKECVVTKRSYKIRSCMIFLRMKRMCQKKSRKPFCNS